uniref:Uncharacterized protein n=1 Tax=Bactrocera dorsalis TaxID=27457 RepID=A0A034VGV9_BACDO
MQNNNKTSSEGRQLSLQIIGRNSHSNKQPLMSEQGSKVPYNSKNNCVTYGFSRTQRAHASNSSILVVGKLGNNNKQIGTNHRNYNNSSNMIFDVIMKSGKNGNSNKYNNCNSNKSIDSCSRQNIVRRSRSCVGYAGAQQLVQVEKRMPHINAVLKQLYASAALKAGRRIQHLLYAAIAMLTTTIKASVLTLAAKLAVAKCIHANFIYSHEHINEYRHSRPLCLVN